MPEFMVERYLPGVTAQEVENAVRRTETAIATMAAEGNEVRYLQSTFVPSEQSVFCLFEASSAESVRAVNARAGFRVDRIVEVRLVKGRESRTRDSIERVSDPGAWRS